ncbi:MAG TPA: NAD(P)H-hydrate dehydratase [Oligoflexia bacterium]|nr:NAD(P)H-hydrate dehydratase [Oligoflexia bacterium]HMP48609.1 NAD(P)H-hydrate dehydratase [Oligoflexia bacterium]
MNLKIVGADIMKQIDTECIDRFCIPERVLVETAGRACFRALIGNNDFRNLSHFVFVGSGNNGADGYVIARLLLSGGFKVKVVSLPERVPNKNSGSEVLESVKQSYLALGGDVIISPQEDSEISFLVDGFPDASIFIDALTGTGFSGVLREGPLSCLIKNLNQARLSRGCLVFSVDLPSGNYPEEGVFRNGLVADETWALQCLKQIHVDPDAADKVGRVRCLDIGMPDSVFNVVKESSELLTSNYIGDLLSSRFPDSENSYKSQKGHVLVVGGSQGYEGAPALSSLGAFRSGAGLVSVVTPDGCVRSLPPEAMHKSVPASDNGTFGVFDSNVWDLILSRKNSVVLGPGFGLDGSGLEDFIGLLLHAINNQSLPAVLDADVLNLLASNNSLKALVSDKMVLTPHPGEFSRIMGCSISDVKAFRMKLSREFVENIPCTLVLKGPRTLVTTSGGDQYFCPHREPALGVAGSGDVLSGVIGAFMARGFSPAESALLGVFVHGETGSRFSAKVGFSCGALISEIIDELPSSISYLLSCPFDSVGNLPARPEI